jgi:hypothetical protein
MASRQASEPERLQTGGMGTIGVLLETCSRTANGGRLPRIELIEAAAPDEALMRIFTADSVDAVFGGVAARASLTLTVRCNYGRCQQRWRRTRGMRRSTRVLGIEGAPPTGRAARTSVERRGRGGM